MQKAAPADLRCWALNDYKTFGKNAETWYNIDLEWDLKKEKLNRKKHGVAFEEAATALSDPMAATGADPDHSDYEERYITFGVSAKNRILVVSHTEEGETIRLISARKTSKGERKLYEEG
ncbi:MAG: BrnT family toxin [Thermodesulfobacteriota bacterium]|nr:BrnT family toxin [Thermodesulfobacteriota bacterium]